MAASTQATPSPTSRSFAGMLADYATPEKKFPPARDLDGLADDIATLSYEHALRAHARYRAEEPPSAPATGQQAALFPPQAHAEASPEPAANARKCASVTVRLTGEENDRLRGRAAEAGMTISAYLRACAFEVESLRAEVKQTISELRRTELQPSPAPLWSRLAPWRSRRKAQAKI